MKLCQFSSGTGFRLAVKKQMRRKQSNGKTRMHVETLFLNQSDMENYSGAKVEIKGKLSADISGNFFLQPVKTEIKQPAPKETSIFIRAENVIQTDCPGQQTTGWKGNPALRQKTTLNYI